jgi:hypothetical protein
VDGLARIREVFWGDCYAGECTESGGVVPQCVQLPLATEVCQHYSTCVYNNATRGAWPAP